MRVAIWDVFKEHGIEIPYPHIDVHIKPQLALNVRLKLFSRIKKVSFYILPAIFNKGVNRNRTLELRHDN